MIVGDGFEVQYFIQSSYRGITGIIPEEIGKYGKLWKKA
jgi:hypothetical protein